MILLESYPFYYLPGVDDMQMCELSLDETGLTRKRGAEILEHEFNREWEKHGGGAYMRPSSRTIVK
jgi:myosin-6